VVAEKKIAELLRLSNADRVRNRVSESVGKNIRM
jgi:hypothetical protein